MVIDEQYETALIEALRHLGEAKGLIDMTIRDIGDGRDARSRFIRDTLTGMAKRISSTRREGEKLCSTPTELDVGRAFEAASNAQVGRRPGAAMGP